MDPRTRMILFKLLSRQTVSEINGSISTGKEANVYHATAPTGMDRAIKVGTGIFSTGFFQKGIPVGPPTGTFASCALIQILEGFTRNCSYGREISYL